MLSVELKEEWIYIKNKAEVKKFVTPLYASCFAKCYSHCLSVGVEERKVCFSALIDESSCEVVLIDDESKNFVQVVPVFDVFDGLDSGSNGGFVLWFGAEWSGAEKVVECENLDGILVDSELKVFQIFDLVDLNESKEHFFDDSKDLCFDDIDVDGRSVRSVWLESV